MVIAIDWDHTLMNGKIWLPGAQDALRRFKEEGHLIIINSCNSEAWIKRQLEEEGLTNLIAAVVAEGSYYSAAGLPKPVADLYIDDRGWRFPRNGSWTEELPKILEILEDERKL